MSGAHGPMRRFLRPSSTKAEAPAAAPERKPLHRPGYCRECRQPRTTFSSGLCFHCVRNPAVRARRKMRPQQSYQLTEVPLTGKMLEQALATARLDMRAELRRGPLAERTLSQRTAYPVETLREAAAGCGWFAVEGGVYGLTEAGVKAGAECR